MNRQFVALSGVAMVLIVLNHAIHMSLTFPAQLGYETVTGWSRFLLTILQALGVFAVPIFLFISGAFVAYAARGSSGLSVKFVWSSVKHILWPYLIWSCIFYLVVFLQNGEKFSLVGYAKNLIVGYPFHFVPLLMFFYIASPILIPLARRHSLLILLVIGLYQLLLLSIRDPGLFPVRFPPLARYLFPPVIGNTFADWGIYFPMGVVSSLHTARLKPALGRWKGVFALATILFFSMGMLHARGLVYAPWARVISPLPFIFLLPVIGRKAIPSVNRLEQIGKRSYGLYLTHLIVLSLILIPISLYWPSLLRFSWILFPLLFIVGLALPLVTMNVIAQQPSGRRIFRYVFG